MNFVNLLKHYQDYDSVKDGELLDEAIATLEDYFSTMDKDVLLHRSRPLAIAYLALKHEKDNIGTK